MRVKNSKKGQSILEYAILIVVVVGALIAMQWYMKGGYQGRIRSASDDLGEQYSPTRVISNITTNSTSVTNETTSGGGGFNSSVMPTTRSNFWQNQTRGVDETLEGFGNATTDLR